MPVPDWVKDAVFYQIFPDRFFNGDPGNDPVNVQPWGSPPTRRGFQGGDLRGITKKIDYLVDLGINALYLNPIFMAASTHRYDTIDYLRIDPKLGDLDDFHTLIETAHRSGMRVILDGVFNHCARGFFAFNDIMENQSESPYLDWFHIRKFPLRAYEKGYARNYQAWWGIKSLPKLNTGNPHVRRYLLDVARYWIEQGADGWRLDVPNEIDDDDFWAEFREVVRAANPQAYILGEIWEAIPRWVNDQHFDGLMNYPVRGAVLGYLNGSLNTQQFADQVERLHAFYPREFVPAMYGLLGSHDTERILTLLGGDIARLRLAYLFHFANSSAPAIYYGDEIGMQGGKDPDCRGAFPWNPAEWNTDLHSWVKTLVKARKTSKALRQGEFCRLMVSNKPAGYAFSRQLEDEQVIVAMNASRDPVTLHIPTSEMSLAPGRVLRSLLDQQETTVQDGFILVQLEPYGGQYFH